MSQEIKTAFNLLAAVGSLFAAIHVHSAGLSLFLCFMVVLCLMGAVVKITAAPQD